MPSKPRTITNPDRVNKVKTFLSDSLDDYIASRVLFLSNLPQQAAILSSTAIEKCFKAILAFNGNESHGHLKSAHWKAVKNFNKNLFDKLNLDFLELNRKAYQLRYTDDLPIDFNLVIATREFLAELDHTFILIHELFTVDGDKERKTKFQSLISTQDLRLIAENHVLLGTDKASFIYDSPQFIYEVRKPKNRDGLLESLYTSATKPEETSFLRTGFTVIDLAKFIYKLSHMPLSEDNIASQNTGGEAV